jgi:glyoxylase-like metal-dependent hydrolase (beta-lactamase superfamily II)
MIFEQIATGGCQSYLLGCDGSHSAILIDPHLNQMDRYLGLAAKDGLRIRYVLDTHTHADHFSAAKELGKTLDVPVVTSKLSPAPYASFKLEDGEILRVGNMRLHALHTPGHTRDSMCILAEDRIFTGDTLLIGGTGRTDLPTGDPDQLYDSLFGRVLKQAPALLVYPAHDYKGRSHSTIGDEIANNPRLQKRERAEFIAMMKQLNLDAPTHLTEARAPI